MASNPSRIADKFDSRGVPCLFLGYPQHQKGYKLLNLLNHSRFVSRDVVFYEHIFPYSKTSMLQVLQPMPAPITSPLWFEDFVSTTHPVNEPSEPAHDTHDASPVHDSAPTMEQPTQVEEPSLTTEVPPSFAPATTVQDTGIRRSSRVSNTPSWLKDYVTSAHHPKANQVSVTPLQSQFHAFLCALVAHSKMPHVDGHTREDASSKGEDQLFMSLLPPVLCISIHVY
ncbi:hypothetical protein CTI12_AA412910 [Artemisia annua]|uniref:Retroviral polymerase SH3-like domain-containing protein n=1 Tax=Artemisia annua TaxID=35608 RepID=A0A2U1M708_ARTAN|nr:hypothetical protein CTI12_AA412910 [Artemisia annua]